MPFVVHVVESFGAGTLSMVCAIANGQAQRGWRVCVIHSIREETPTNWRDLFHPDVTFRQLEMVREISPLKDILCALKLASIFRTMCPDVVHLHSSKAGALGRIVCTLMGHPRCFFSPHGLSFLQSSPGNKKQSLFLIIEKILAKTSHQIIACSPSEKENIQSYLGRDACLLENAIDIDSIPLAHHSTGEVIKIGMVGRITRARNPSLFSAVAQGSKDLPVRFFWIGGGEAEGHALLSSSGVHVTGWMNRSCALERLASLDIYIQTSLWEGMPIAVMEAMAAGLPVVATNIVGNKDLVKNGVTGFLVEDADGFVDAIGNLIGGGVNRKSMGELGREEIRKNHGVPTMLDKLEKLYYATF